MYAQGEPPRGVMAVHRARSPTGANFIALAARDADAAGRLGEDVPRGFTILHLTDEFPLEVLEPRAEELSPLSACLFELLPQDFSNHPDDQVCPLRPDWAGRIEKLEQTAWPA